MVHYIELLNDLLNEGGTPDGTSALRSGIESLRLHGRAKSEGLARGGW